MEYLSSMPFPNKVYFSQNDLKVFGLLKRKFKSLSSLGHAEFRNSFYNENRKALERALLVYRKMGIIER